LRSQKYIKNLIFPIITTFFCNNFELLSA